MTVKARVPGFGSMSSGDQDRYRFALEEIGDSVFSWDLLNPVGKPTVNGDILSAKGIYTGLPKWNSDFGEKWARLKNGADIAAEAKFEVFFDKTAKNHPDGQPNSPNWFHYWRQSLPMPNNYNLEYGGSDDGMLTGDVPAGTGWSYVLAPRDKTLIRIFDAACELSSAYGVGEMFSGIDRFFGTVIHEAKHTNQIALADQLVPNGQPGTPWLHGWSWQQANHNHWTLGADGKPGIAGVDDDNDGTIDNLITTGPGELGPGDDEPLSHSEDPLRSWPAAWQLPNPRKVLSLIESDAINASDQAHDEHLSARDDWGNPGKNHGTINKYDD